MGAIIPVSDLKNSISLHEYINIHYPHIELKRNGNVYQGLCPFHSEKTPSFTVFQNNTFKCFGCGEHGDIISFIQKIENVDFKEACVMLGESVGINVSLEPTNIEHEKYKDIMDSHSKRYLNNLFNNQTVLQYLINERGLTKETIMKFRIGLVPDDEYKNRNDIGGISGRISFPIFEHKDHKYAKCIGMGYRTLKDEKPKYINDKNKDKDEDGALKGVFVKGNTLYGYQFAYQEIRKLNFAIIVEGYMDVISMHQSGVLNAVGIMGTALTKVQIDILKKLTTNLVLFLDGDSAGVVNMFKIAPELIENGFNVMIIVAEGNKDAADVCKELNYNMQSIRTYINRNAKPIMNEIIHKATEDFEQVITRERLKILNKLTPYIDKVQNPYEKEMYLKMLYKRLYIA